MVRANTGHCNAEAINNISYNIIPYYKHTNGLGD